MKQRIDAGGPWIYLAQYLPKVFPQTLGTGFPVIFAGLAWALRSIYSTNRSGNFGCALTPCYPTTHTYGSLHHHLLELTTISRACYRLQSLLPPPEPAASTPEHLSCHLPSSNFSTIAFRLLLHRVFREATSPPPPPELAAASRPSRYLHAHSESEKPSRNPKQGQPCWTSCKTLRTRKA